MSAAAAIDATSPVSTIASGARRDDDAGSESPTGSSRPPTRRLPGALNGVGPRRVRRSRTSAAIVSTSIDGDRDAVGARQPGHPAAAREHHERSSPATVTSTARAGVPNRV